VNRELTIELTNEIRGGRLEEAVRIAGVLRDNEDKVVHHGQRAEAIVKGMLQHSRNDSGIKESVDINALVEEYSRLAFHGARAREKGFNVKLETALDGSAGQVKIIPQEIGRVVLNLITNAFQAVSGKVKGNADGYVPMVALSTMRLGDMVEIRVKDNGPGIPSEFREKIFQPFFTTKPAGQGTGLGLSISYDILKKHGGEINVVSESEKGTEFIVRLPAVE
jgi:signal transduction histidine kinase